MLRVILDKGGWDGPSLELIFMSGLRSMRWGWCLSLGQLELSCQIEELMQRPWGRADLVAFWWD